MSTTSEYDYSLDLTRVEDHVSFQKLAIPAAALEMVKAQMRFDAMRSGNLPADAGNAHVSVEPVFEPQGNRITAIRMAIGEGAMRMEREFNSEIFRSAADSHILQLVRGKQLGERDEVVFQVNAHPTADVAYDDGVVASVKIQPLPLQPGELAPFLADAEPVGPHNESDHPVFILDSVLQQSQEYSWKGRDAEGGAWLVGTLYQQQQPKPEIFLLVHTVLEARETNHGWMSLDLSPASFAHFQSQLQLRRQRLGRNADVAAGFFHTHPFLPSVLDGKEACPSCPLQPECNLTSSFFSKQDSQFHGAVFGRAPYAVELVLGLTPREEFDLKMFGMDGGGFRERGYYRLAEAPAMVHA